MLPLFKNQDKFEPTVGSQKLEMENILVYYVDEKAPTFTTDRASGGVFDPQTLSLTLVLAACCFTILQVSN